MKNTEKVIENFVNGGKTRENARVAGKNDAKAVPASRSGDK